MAEIITRDWRNGKRETAELDDYVLTDDGPFHVRGDGRRMQLWKIEKIPMIIYLTDGNEILASRRVRNEAELGQLNSEAQEATAGNLWWQTAVDAASHDELFKIRLEELGHEPVHQ